MWGECNMKKNLLAISLTTISCFLWLHNTTTSSCCQQLFHNFICKILLLVVYKLKFMMYNIFRITTESGEDFVQPEYKEIA